MRAKALNTPFAFMYYMSGTKDAQSGKRSINTLDIEDEIARTEEAHERTAWRQRLYDMEGE